MSKEERLKVIASAVFKAKHIPTTCVLSSGATILVAHLWVAVLNRWWEGINTFLLPLVALVIEAMLPSEETLIYENGTRVDG